MRVLCLERLLNVLLKRPLRYDGVKATLQFSTSSKSMSSGLEWSYYHGPTEQPLTGATIGKLVQSAAEKYGSRDAFVSVHQDLRYSFEDLLEKSDELAAGLLSLGVKRGDRVGIWAPNIMEWIITQYGTARAGFVLVNINPAYRTVELEYAMNKVGIKALITVETFKSSNYYEMLKELVPGLAECDPHKIKSDRLPHLNHIIVAGEKKLPGAFRFCDVLEMATNETKHQIYNLQNVLQFDDVINIQFTSGTTGNPKGAALSHHNIINNAKSVAEVIEYHKVRTRVAMPVPLYHCFGMVLGSLTTVVHGSTIVLPSAGFDPSTTLQAAQDEKCRSLYGTPTMFIDMLEAAERKQYDLSCLSTGIMAGAPCPIEVMKKVIEKLNMKKVTIAYGTTENSPATCQTAVGDPLEKRVSTVGKPLPHCEAKVIDENGRITPTGTKGELCIRGYCVMLQYWDDPDKTRQVIGDDRWYKTGDIAVMDEEGYVQIIGRSKDLIIRGGENIYPTEVEQLLYKHPKIADVQVIGVPDRRLGEQVCAWIKLKDGETATPEEIKEFCAEKIAHFKIPHYIQFVKDYPMTVTGKIQKYKMREAAIQQLHLEDI